MTTIANAPADEAPATTLGLMVRLARLARTRHAVTATFGLALVATFVIVASPFAHVVANPPFACTTLAATTCIARIVAKRSLTIEDVVGMALACMLAFVCAEGALRTHAQHDIGAIDGTDGVVATVEIVIASDRHDALGPR